jgi:Fur family transcriptional regulator, ferric uptake regulator
MSAAVFDQARELLKGKAERLTSSRLSVLAVLLQSSSALSHTEVQVAVEQINPAHVDRVTIYRVLEWLTEVGLAHRVSGVDRVFRFSSSSNSQAHGHFLCSDCHRMFCIDSKIAPNVAHAVDLGASVNAMLPTGFVSTAIDLTISGRCAECA